MREKRSFVAASVLIAALLCPTYAIGQVESTTKTETEQQQNSHRIIKGKVIDSEGHSMIGVNVIVNGWVGGTITDLDGNFMISAPREDIVLKVSYIGMETQLVTVKANQKKEIQIRMKENTNQIDEVVVTGYSNLKKESFTGNTISVKRDELMKVSKTNVISALQTFDPSFRIAENNMWGSDPNAVPEVYIRGKSGIGVKELDQTDITSKSALKNNPNLPTFIMDGFEISVTKLYDMDPSRIESITILKDAAATAMYGSRAANGVVVITTVTPKPGKINVSYSLTGTVELPDLSDYNMMNAAQKLEAERIAGVFDDPTHNFDSDNQNLQYYYKKLYNVQNGVDTYWLSAPLHTPFDHNHSLYIDGGSEKIRFGVEMNLKQDNGVMRGSSRQVWGAGAYIQYSVGRFIFRNHTTYDSNNSKESPYGTFSNYVSQLPYDRYTDDNGMMVSELPFWNERFNRYNPLYEATLSSFGRSSYEQLINNLSVQWNITDNLLFKSTLGITRQFESSENFLDPRSKKNSEPLSATNLSSGELRTGSGNSFSYDWQASLAYNRFISKHNINASLGINMREDRNKNLSAFYKGFPSGSLTSPNYAQKIVEKPTQSEEHSRLVGLLGLVNYSYDNIYLFDASVRMDGSSKFGSDNKFAPFWSLGAGLNIHNYPFLKDVKAIDLLKVRASYGQVGNVNFASYDAKTTYRILTDQWYKTGYGAVLYSLGNQGLTWETTNTLDIGFELSLLNNLFYIRGSYYIKNTVDCINSVTIPSHSGFTTYMDNIGEVENKGVEFDVRSNVFRNRDWNVNIFANMSHNKNRIVKVAESLKAYNDKVDEFLNDPSQVYASNGTHTGSKSYKKYSEGVSQSAIWAMESIGIDPATGEEIYRNPNGTLTKYWNSANQVVVGDEEPKVRGSFGFNVTWKNFSLYTTFMYECGGQRYNQTLADKVEGIDIVNDNADLRVLTDRWKNPGDISGFKKLQMERDTGYETTRATSRFVQDYNWLSLNSITLEYDFDAKYLKPLHLSMLRLGIGANELGRWSTVKLERGLSYPYSRTINFSLKASF
ncbi:SusC/RagA family TonB-linked outer membrane protein [Bacteroides xylanisolvens]|uniref:SusC/RagA family TonB-linked outer membrane protein n=1 Tax=Bacteroides xylanisolvens TaxID=371601 RepID=UPI0023082300|nr:SusC/RagA family TonB-linked outer membrane protein [Bacteroides xylanisolvens]MDB0714762.1 SusC/RagA family TonB-linked outer membrane protein [Bacteroides xylanisolvens]MDB0734456.1 SusC/RagA family TonB-linked outer membrane protein [Bacteroides xylanisolvens]